MHSLNILFAPRLVPLDLLSKGERCYVMISRREVML